MPYTDVKDPARMRVGSIPYILYRLLSQGLG